MLRAFDNIEYSRDSMENMKEPLFPEELRIAKSLVEKIPKAEEGLRNCLCGAEEMQLFFQKWGVPYYRCRECGAIQAAACPASVNAYNAAEELKRLRLGEAYQRDAGICRDLNWEELIEWVRFRTFRYLGLKRAAVADIGNRYKGFCEKMRSNPFFAPYTLCQSILYGETKVALPAAPYDVILYINQLQGSTAPLQDLRAVLRALRPGGLFFLGTRIGAGFDILVLKEHAQIYPYEHVFLPSLPLLKSLLEQADLKVLDVSTPGRLDSVYVAKNKEQIAPGETFVRYLMEHGDKSVLQELQRFLQISGTSSYAQIVAQKET